MKFRGGCNCFMLVISLLPKRAKLSGDKQGMLTPMHNWYFLINRLRKMKYKRRSRRKWNIEYKSLRNTAMHFARYVNASVSGQP